MTYNNFFILILIFVSLSLTSCFKNISKELNYGKNTVDIYNQQVSEENGLGYYPYANNNLSEFTRDSKNELDVLFPTLPNPDIFIYSFPHISKSGLPIPGYMTKIKMYPNAINFALPNENIENE